MLDKDLSQAITVSQLNEYMKALVDRDPVLSHIYLRGEISNFVHHRTGHFYFSLKDEAASVRAVMFRGDASRIRFAPEDGMKVLVRGEVSVFVRDGQYQVYVHAMEPEGIGSLYLAFEQLKKKLSAEGLFSEEHKLSLPKFPKKIGVVTSPTGAAIRDIITVLGRRFPYAEVLLYPAQVQGPEASHQLSCGVSYFNTRNDIDVIILGRGGGSTEDLWAFNHEGLARTVFASKIPVISAVGHEVDFTICDFVADRRAATPSAAAELATPDLLELQSYLSGLKNRMTQALLHKLRQASQSLSSLQKNSVYSHTDRLFSSRHMQLTSLLDHMSAQMEKTTQNKFQKFKELAAKTEALNPLATLQRGYTVTYRDGAQIASMAEIRPKDALQIRFRDGMVYAITERAEIYKKQGDQLHGDKK